MLVTPKRWMLPTTLFNLSALASFATITPVFLISWATSGNSKKQFYIKQLEFAFLHISTLNTNLQNVWLLNGFSHFSESLIWNFIILCLVTYHIKSNIFLVWTVGSLKQDNAISNVTMRSVLPGSLAICDINRQLDPLIDWLGNDLGLIDGSKVK